MEWFIALIIIGILVLVVIVSIKTKVPPGVTFSGDSHVDWYPIQR